MSTPSPVAKQAAKAEIENTCSNDTQPLGYFVQQAIDTVTAKSETRCGEQAVEWTEGELHKLVMDLRVATGFPENLHQRFFDLLQPWFTAHNAATAKLREELAKLEKRATKLEANWSGFLEQLAHQQPSATCPDCKQTLSGDDMVDREMHGRCHSQGEPSATKFELHHGQMCELCSGCEDDENFDYCRACGFTKLPISFHLPPTPDVEKIATEAAEGIAKTRGEDQPQQMDVAFIRYALVQASEPLVAALGVLLDCIDYTKGNCKLNAMVGAELSKEVIAQARAALTGTKEK